MYFLGSVNANLDLIVSATALLRALNVTPAPPSDHDSLSSLDHLQDVVANSMLHCAGVERFFADQDIFQQTVEAAARLPHTVSRARLDLLPQCNTSLVPAVPYRGKCWVNGTETATRIARGTGQSPNALY